MRLPGFISPRRETFGFHLPAAVNGSSEFMTNISVSIVNMLYNYQLMRMAGEYGVSAYGIIMYTNFIFLGVFFGYAIGASPIIGYHYGTGEKAELKNVFSKSFKLIAIFSIFMVVIAEALSKPLAMIFAELMVLALTIFCVVKNRKKYGYY